MLKNILLKLQIYIFMYTVYTTTDRRQTTAHIQHKLKRKKGFQHLAIEFKKGILPHTIAIL